MTGRWPRGRETAMGNDERRADVLGEMWRVVRNMLEEAKEEMGIAEELRDKARWFRKGKINCTRIARAFGIDCGSVMSCDECNVLTLERIADRIDAERQLPEGIEWPRFEDGEPVKFDDTVEHDGDTMRVGAVWLHREGWGLHVSCPSVEGTFHGAYGERVKRPDSWERLEADAKKRVCEYAGAQKSIVDDGRYSCTNCSYDEPGIYGDGCNEKMRRDLVRRAKALAKAGE